ncbi:MAG: hypothetical protein AAFX06_31055 [Planctomycetota bacterium]
MSTVIEKIESSNKASEADVARQVADAWRAIWSGLARDVASIATDQDVSDIQEALGTLTFFEVTEDETETLRECRATMKKMFDRTVASKLADRVEELRIQAIADHKRFSRFAAKMEKQLKKRSRVVAVDRPSFAPVAWSNDDKYAGLLRDGGDQCLAANEDVQAVIDRLVDERSTETKEAFDQRSLPTEVTKYVDEYNIAHPNYQDFQDSEYVGCIPGAVEKQRHAERMTQVDDLRRQIAFLSAETFTQVDFKRPLRRGYPKLFHSAANMIGCTSPVEFRQSPSADDLRYGRPESLWPDEPFLDEELFRRFDQLREQKIAELRLGFASLSNEKCS